MCSVAFYVPPFDRPTSTIRATPLNSSRTQLPFTIATETSMCSNDWDLVYLNTACDLVYFGGAQLLYEL